MKCLLELVCSNDVISELEKRFINWYKCVNINGKTNIGYINNVKLDTSSEYKIPHEFLSNVEIKLSDDEIIAEKLKFV